MTKNYRLLKRIEDMYKNKKLFALKIGVWPSIVGEVINGKRNISPKQQRKWAKALKCERDIFEVADENNKETLYNI